MPPDPPAIRVLLVDDHRSVLWGLEKLIAGEKPRMEVAGTATTSAAALELARNVRPDVVLLDLDLAGESGSDIIEQLVQECGSRVLILTGARDPKVRENAILRGACGVVLKDEPAHTILRAIDKVHAGELWLDRTTAGRVFMELSRAQGGTAADPEQRQISTLTARERQIIEQIVNEPGADNRTIAKKLHMGERTLRNHLTHIYQKLGTPSRLELYVYARKHALSGRSK